VAALIFPRGQHFTYHFQVADVHKPLQCKWTFTNLSCYYTTQKIPHGSTSSIRIYFEIFF